jgi:hypothetical protein
VLSFQESYCIYKVRAELYRGRMKSLEKKTVVMDRGIIGASSGIGSRVHVYVLLFSCEMDGWMDG